MKRKAGIGIAVLAAAGAGLLLSQRAATVRPFASLVPAGPLVYAEAKDLAALVRDWNTSAEKKAWLDSESYRVFANSRLAMRLDAARQELSAALTSAVGMPLVESMAGGNSAVALYQIGDLEFLFLTRMPAARASQTALWQARAKFQPRQASGIDYFVRREGGRTIAFAVTGDLLLAATAEDPLAGALALVAGRTPAALAGESWFQRAIAAQPEQGDVRLAVNLERTTATPYFRSYWIQRNRTMLKPFRALIADLDRGAVYRERRTLLRDEAAGPVDEAGAAELAKLAPAAAGLVRVWAAPEPEAVLDLVADKFFARAPESSTRGEHAPAVGSLDGVTGSEGDVEVRVDEARPAAESATPDMAALRTLLAANPATAMLQVESSQPTSDGEFVTTPRAIALLGVRAWGALPAVPNATLASNGRVLVIATSAEFAQPLLQGSSGSPLPAASYAMRYQMASELPRFRSMMTRIDFPRRAGSSEPGQEPMFFSGNMASLGTVLARVESVELQSHDQGAVVKQTVTYRLR